MKCAAALLTSFFALLGLSGCTMTANGVMPGTQATPTLNADCSVTPGFVPFGGPTQQQISECQSKRAAELAEAQQQEQQEEQEQAQQQAAAAQQAAEAAAVQQKAKEAAIAAAEANPSQDLSEFETDMNGDNYILLVANEAIACHRRTAQWYFLVKNAYTNDYMRERMKIPLTDAEAGAEQAYTQQNTSVDSSSIDCSTLPNAADLANIDQQEQGWLAEAGAPGY